MTLDTARAPLGAWLDDRRQEVDAALDRWLPAAPAAPAVIVESMRYSLRAGGKRLRPMLALAAAEAAGEIGTPPLAPREARALALPAACALELIHTYSLVHDDLPAMDNDVLRRGRPTLHVVDGEGMAILAGDGLLTEAFGLLSREPASREPWLAARKLAALGRIAYAAGAAGMVGGQAVDLQACGQAGPRAPRLVLDARSLADLHARKTGALIRAAAVSGAIMAGADDPVLNAIDMWATEMGLAFQIIDDVLDVEGDAAEIGKTAGKDAAAGKITYPSLFGLERSRALAHDAVTRGTDALDRARVPAHYLRGIAAWIVERRS